MTAATALALPEAPFPLPQSPWGLQSSSTNPFLPLPPLSPTNPFASPALASPSLDLGGAPSPTPAASEDVESICTYHSAEGSVLTPLETVSSRPRPQTLEVHGWGQDLSQYRPTADLPTSSSSSSEEEEEEAGSPAFFCPCSACTHQSCSEHSMCSVYHCVVLNSGL